MHASKDIVLLSTLHCGSLRDNGPAYVLIEAGTHTLVQNEVIRRMTSMRVCGPYKMLH